MHPIYRLLFVVFVLLTTGTLAIPQSIAETVDLIASQDNTLFESESGALSNGAGDHFFVGKTFQGVGSIRRGLLMFDVASAIPSGANITDASLTLLMNKTINPAADIGLHVLESAWGEGASHASGEEGMGTVAEPGDATWTHRISPSDAWNNPGGDFNGTASATVSVDNFGSYTWNSPQVIADVQGWLDDPSSNSGWILIGNETSGSAKRFSSRENANESDRPLLSVTYEVNGGGSPADFDGDGDVDGDDLTQWQADYGVNGESDANDDGASDGQDFLIWQREHTGPGAVVSSPIMMVPEPTSLALLLAAMSFGCGRRGARR